MLILKKCSKTMFEILELVQNLAFRKNFTQNSKFSLKIEILSRIHINLLSSNKKE